MAATSCQIYFPPFFSSLWGFPSVHWLPNVCLCHWDLMAITIITTSWVRQAVQPPPFIATEGFTTLYWGFVYASLSFIILPYICLRYCHSNAPALWLRPLVRVKRKQEGVGRKILHSVYPAIIQLTDTCAKSSELSIYVIFGPLRACATVTYWKEWPCKNHKNQKPWGSWNPHQAGHLQVLNGFLGSLHG